MDKRRNDLLTTVSPQTFVLGPLTMAWLARGLWGAFTRFERTLAKRKTPLVCALGG
jgi:hypothetical protein